MKKYVAEFFGTLVLSLIVILSVSGVALKTTPVLAAVTLGFLVYTIGSVSGSHINPAVTFGLWVLGKIKQQEAVSYIAAQMIGAMSAVGIAWVLVEDLSSRISGVQDRVGNDPLIGLAEVLGAVIFGFGIMAVVSEKVKQELSGVIIGGSLFLGLLIAGSVSNALLNPAVALALGSIDIMHMIGPFIGMVLGMRLFLYLSPEKKKLFSR
ncbi:MAG: aquaporin [Candidatus Roizmanbacteria bacterium]|nr:aquaporin [Candidatus Roizmanbacteria bacterium]